ncbi:MAG: single-stranded DNA-binding protein [Methylomicrobium sp.]|nr:single-stranded DNA-binding protein [Methylomicrobium sp.]
MNKCQFHGFLGADPVLKYFPDGGAKVSFSMAVSERWKDKQTGEIKERTDWLRMVCSGKRAEVIAEHFKKGSEILIADAQFRNREYTQNGEKKYISEFTVRDFEFCGKKPSAGEPGRHNPDGKNQHEDSKSSSAFPDDDFYDDDIPF